jgi:anti-sigma regulatory factor (Ser/Thr protein kinase)
MATQATKAPPAIDFEHTYPGTADQAGQVRADLTEVAGDFPVTDKLVLLASELATNAVLHSKSGKPGGMFTVRVTLYAGEYAWVEVVDQGGAWVTNVHDDEHGRGLSIVATVAGGGNWGIEGNNAARVAWFRLDWARP